jgi:hypothetical protein
MMPRFASRARTAIDRLLAIHIAQPTDIRPCSDQDIHALEEADGVRLPLAYKSFLAHMGRGCGRFLTNDHFTAVFYDDLTPLQRSVREHLADVPLPPDLFCFATRMGELYLFFSADGQTDDPPILYWNEETDPSLKVAFPSFWDWIDVMVSDCERIARRPT